MLKNLSRLEMKIGEKVYHFTCDVDSPLGEIKESLFQFLKYIGQIEDQIKTQLEKSKVEQIDQENSKVKEIKQEVMEAL